MRAKFKKWAVPFMEVHPEYVVESVDASVLESKNVYLEIGTGKGDFIIEMAKNNPDKFFYGVELNSSIAGICTKKLVASEVSNAQLICGDVQDQFPFLKDESIEGLFLNFSDPWPKKRHEKRRLTYPSKLDEYYRLLKKGSKLYFKTDNYPFYEYSKKMFLLSKFKMIFDTEDYEFNAEFDAMTEYEKLWRSRNVKINRIILIKE